MKLVMDEKLKHRLVGVGVILSLGAIFLPAMMKKSNQRLENSFSVNVQLPPKPMAPNVAVTDEEQMFKTIKIARVKLPEKHSEQIIAKEEFMVSVPVKESVLVPVANKTVAIKEAPGKNINVAVSDVIKMTASNSKSVPVKVIAPMPIKAIASKNTSSKKDIYAVQLASFAKLSNAQALVSKLQGKGYKANYIRVTGKNGAIYKVYVGHSPIKHNVLKLKTQLASAMQLNGFVVNTGVS